MSTGYHLFENKEGALSITEVSGQFDLDYYDKYYDKVISIAERLEATEVIDVAFKLIQPTLYNVKDPKEFFEKEIKARLEKLHV